MNIFIRYKNKFKKNKLKSNGLQVGSCYSFYKKFSFTRPGTLIIKRRIDNE